MSASRPPAPVPSLDRLRRTLLASAPVACQRCGEDGAYERMKAELERERAALALTRMHEHGKEIAPYDRVRDARCPGEPNPPHAHDWVTIAIYFRPLQPGRGHGLPLRPGGMAPALVELFECTKCGAQRLLSDDPATKTRLAGMLR
tara:strand:+ start:115 stop:552 length:438 start_codon:yes stop_codon:yes gene_type:complete